MKTTTRVTKKFVKQVVKLRSSATPNSIVRSALIFDDSCLEIHGYDSNDMPISLEDKILSNMKKWGWVSDRGLLVLTQLGYSSL